MRGSHSGQDYVEAITARRSDRLARSAFQALVQEIASPGAALFDFGAGPGIDAKFYAEQGYVLQAYDVDPQMCEYFSVHCRNFMQTGQVSLERGTYEDFLARKIVNDRRVALITSNFAPLNLIDDLQGLFAKFSALTGQGGKVLASVLSPYFVGDMRYAWWWRNSRRLLRDGHFSVRGSQASIVRRRLANYADQCAPHFTLTRVFPGLPSRRGEMNGVDWSRARGHAWIRLTTCRFMFLLFEKRG
jgi:SAM-dependent methyltransferase